MISLPLRNYLTFGSPVLLVIASWKAFRLGAQRGLQCEGEPLPADPGEVTETLMIFVVREEPK